jgi:uncharacterized membrane protein
MFDVFNPIAFQIHGGGHGGVAGAVGDLLAFIERLLSMQPPEILAALLPGVTAMGNHHPLFVHFPIAFLLAFFVLDTVASLAKKEDWRTVAGWFLYFGAAAAIVTVAAGFHAAATVPHGADVHAIMERHKHFGLTVLSLALALSVWRWLGRRFLRRAVNILYLSMAAIMAICITLGADLGGLMVYHYGLNVGIGAMPESAFSHEHEHNHSH